MNPPFSPNAHFLISCERERQVFKLGYDSAHDDQFINFELAKAAQCYMDVALWQLQPGPIVMDELTILEAIQRTWPWEKEAFNPAPSAVGNLVKSGALYSAEKMRIWRRGDKVLANSYDGAINHCAQLIQDELNKEPVPFHEASLTGVDGMCQCVVEKLPGDREILVGLGKDGLKAFRIKRLDEHGRPAVLTFMLTQDAFAALIRCSHKIRLLEDSLTPKHG